MKEIQHLANTCTVAARKAANLAQTATAEGKRRLETIALQNRLHKAQRQLGSLIYSLYKRNEENAILVKRYLDTIERIEEQLNLYQNQENTTNICPNCNSKCDEAAAFCNSCGSKFDK